LRIIEANEGLNLSAKFISLRAGVSLDKATFAAAMKQEGCEKKSGLDLGAMAADGTPIYGKFQTVIFDNSPDDKR
jgi:hypothetical protein